MTQSLPISDTRAIPPALASALQRLIRRSRGIIALRGICAVLAAALLSLLVVMGLDRLIVTYAQWPRWLMTAGFWVATALTGFWFLLRPLAKSFTLAGMAQVIERRHPELQERLSSAVELLTSREDDAFRGSSALIAALASQATDDVRNVQPRSEISLQPAKPFLLAAGSCLLVLAALLWSWPQRTWRGLARGLAPWANISKFADNTILVRPGDTAIPQDEPLRVTATFEDAEVRQARLRLLATDAGEQVFPMSLVGRDEKGRPRFAYTCPPAKRGFRYRVHAAGGDPTRFYHARILPVPSLANLSLRIDLPDYAASDPVVLHPAEGPIRALARSRVTLDVHASCDLDQARIVLEDTQQVLEPIGREPPDTDAHKVTFALNLEEGTKGTWRLDMVSRQGVPGSAGPYELRAVPDQPPTAIILQPKRRDLRLAPDASLPMLLKGQDAIGIAQARILLEADGKELEPIELPLHAEDARTDTPTLLLLRQWRLELAALPLEGVEVVSLRLEIIDTLPETFSGPQRAVSERIRIRLDRDAPPLAQQVILAEELLFRQALEEVLKQLQTARKDSRQLKKDLGRIHSAVASGRTQEPQAKLPDSAVTRIDRAREYLSQAEKVARKASQEAREGTFAPLAEQLDQIRLEYILAAARDAGQIKLSDASGDWSELADRADYRIYQAIKDIEDMLDRLSSASEKARKARKLEDLAKTQEDLAREAGELSPPQDGQDDPEAMEDWKNRQGDVAKDLADMVNQDPQARHLAQKQSAQQARDLVKEAKDLAREQDEEAQASRQRGEIDEIRKKTQHDPKDKQEPGDKSPLEEKLSRAKEAHRKSRLAQLARQQRRIAEEAADLAKKIQKQQPQEDSLPVDAAASAHKTKRKLEQGKTQEATGDAAQAQKKLDQLARRLGNREDNEDAGAGEAGKDGSETPKTPEQETSDRPKSPEDPDAADRPQPQSQEDSQGQKEPSQDDSDQQVRVRAQEVVDQGQGVRTPEEAADRKALGDEARRLNRKQQALRRQLEDLVSGKDAQLARKRQEELNRKTRDLQEAVASVAEEIEDLQVDKKAEANLKQARKAVAAARKKQQEAQEKIQAGRGDEAASSQSEAAKKIDQAGEALEQAGRRLANLASRNAPAESEVVEDTMPGEMVSALEDAAEASATARQEPAASAASKLSELARAAARAAEQAGAQAKGPASWQEASQAQASEQAADARGQTAQSQMGTGPGEASALVTLRLEQLGLSSDDWARLPGRLRNDVIQAAGHRVPAEYRQIVERYFQARAQRRASAGPGEAARER